MAEERALDIRRVTSAMDTTRQSIQDTLGELRERVQESADWRHQVGQRPLTSLWVATTPVFSAAVKVCAPVLTKRAVRSAPSTPDRIRRTRGPKFERLPDAPLGYLFFFGSLSGVPPVATCAT